MPLPDSERLSVVPIPAFNDNYLWLLRRGNQAAIVDPGDAVPVEATLKQLELELCAIVLTHHHRDHTGGVQALCARRQGHHLPVFGPASEDIAGVTVPLVDGDTATIGPLGLALRVLEVPGHTRGHIAYFTPEPEPRLFCGDTLFAGGCGRLFEGTPSQMQASLSRLADLPNETLVYCAHEYTLANLRFAKAVDPDNPVLDERIQNAQALRDAGRPTVPSTIGLERQTNPFLRWDAPPVRAAAEGQVPGSSASAVTTFAAIRAWKDRF